MKKESLKAAITQNFANNEFAVAMEKNTELFKQYEEVAGKRSLASIISYWKKKSGETEPSNAEVSEPILSEGLEQVEDVVKETGSEETTDAPEYKFYMSESKESVLDKEQVRVMLKSDNKSLQRYCITKEEFEQRSDKEQFIRTTMYVKPDGLGWEKASDVNNEIKDRNLKSFRKPGSFYNSECGLPVGEVYVKYTVYKVGEALSRFAFRNNNSGIDVVNCF